MEHLLTALPSKLIVIAICSFLFFLGGYCWLPARRFLLPSFLSLFACFLCHSFYELASLSVCGVFCLGYGEKAPLRHIFGNGWGRSVWGILAAICISLSMLLTGHLHWFLFVPYLILNFTLENALKNIPQVIGDPIIGASFASIVLLIR